MQRAFRSRVQSTPISVPVLAWVGLVFLSLPAAPAAAQLLDVNLVVNGDAESDTGQATMATNIAITGWIDTDVTTAILYGAANFPAVTDPGPPTPGVNIFAAGVASTSSITQEIDITSLASDIDAGGVRFRLWGWFGGLPNQADDIELELRFEDGGGGSVGSASVIGRDLVNHLTDLGLFPEETIGVVPANARKAVLELRGTLALGSFIDGYADDLSLVLSLDPDGDGVSNLDEQTAGTDPLDPDTDGDGLSDAVELAEGFDPLDPDEDLDGRVDGQGDLDLDGLGNPSELAAGTDPMDSDSDADGLLDGEELGTASFGAAQTIDALAADANQVLAADLDGDGDLDVVLTTFDSGTTTGSLAWYENSDGAGSFGAAQTVSGAEDPSLATAADLDGDTDLDLIASLEDIDEIVWYENDGNGGFGAAQTAASLDAGTPVVADLDRDGDLDLLAVSIGASQLIWLENTDGQGSFAGPLPVSSGGLGQLGSPFPADLDGDGDLDVLSAELSGDKFAWYENDGWGNFGTRQLIANSEGAAFVVAADLDGDGDSDLLSSTLDFGLSESRIAWYANTGGSFGTEDLLEVLFFAAGVLAADLDADGDLDVLSSVTSTQLWFENTDGAGSFAGATSLGSGLQHVPADLDGDGDLDLLDITAADAIVWYRQSNAADPLDADSDDDGLCDGGGPSGTAPECALGGEDTNDNGAYDVGVETDPNNPDTDGDGVEDGREVLQGTDPLDPEDFLMVPALSPWGGIALAGLLASLAARRRRVRRER